MLPKPPLKKLVVELRYKPDLGFYGKMDSIGQELANEFADWERSPLTVEVRNKKQHRRLYLSANRAFYDADAPNSESEFSAAEKLLSKISHTLGVKVYKRLGVRQWFAAELGKPFALMVDEFRQRFLAGTNELVAILSDKTKDVAYAVDYETSDGWQYKLRLGPMMKSQWFETVGHEANIYEKESGTATFETFQAEFPDQFLYIDIDCHHEDQPAEKLNEFLTSVRRRSHELAARLFEYCRK